MAEEIKTTIKLKNLITKGHHGYIDRQKRRLLIRSLILGAGVAGLVIIGYIVTKTNKNLMSVMAILTAIPMAMQLAQYLSYRKFSSPSDEEHEKVRQLVGEGVMDTELVIAKRDGATLPLNYAVFTEDCIYGYVPDKKLDLTVYSEYLHNFLRLSSVDGEIKLYNDFSVFLKQLKDKEFTNREEISETVLKREGVFRAISM